MKVVHVCKDVIILFRTNNVRGRKFVKIARFLWCKTTFKNYIKIFCLQSVHVQKVKYKELHSQQIVIDSKRIKTEYLFGLGIFSISQTWIVRYIVISVIKKNQTKYNSKSINMGQILIVLNRDCSHVLHHEKIWIHCYNFRLLFYELL